MSSNTVSTSPNTELKIPSQITLVNAFKKAIDDDKPVLFDYWVGSLNKSVVIGVRQIKSGGGEGEAASAATTEKKLFRNEEEYTSPIVNIFKSEGEFVIVTENSIYIVDAGIPTIGGARLEKRFRGKV